MSKKPVEEEAHASHPGGEGEHGRRKGKLFDLRTYFLTGLVVAAPVAITAYLTFTFVTFVDRQITPLIPPRYNPNTYVDFTIPGLGVLVVLIALTILGALTANLFGRTIIGLGEKILDRMPVVSSIYSALKQIFETVLAQSDTTFKQVCLVEYPRKGIWAIGFVSTSARGEIASRVDKEMLSVFLPTTPNPTSGFLLFVPRSDVIILDMSVEEGAKMVISAGLVVPEPGNGGRRNGGRMPGEVEPIPLPVSDAPQPTEVRTPLSTTDTG